MPMRWIGLILLTLGAPQDVKHRFLATDGETSKLIYVDQFHPEKDWTVETPKGPRDLRKVGEKTILVSHRTGAIEVDLDTGKQTWSVSGYREVHAAIRLANGHTLLVGPNRKGGHKPHGGPAGRGGAR